MIFKYSDKGISGKLYYFECKLIEKYHRSRWCRSYTLMAQNYNPPQTIKFKPYAQTITEFDLNCIATEEQIRILAMRFNELVHQYNHMLDIANIEEPFVY